MLPTVDLGMTRAWREGWIETWGTDDARGPSLALATAGRRVVNATLPAWKESLDRHNDRT